MRDAVRTPWYAPSGMSHRAPLLIALAGVAAWLVGALATWAGGAPLGHDEAQYAIAARETLAGEAPRWFYLSRGMNALAIPGIVLGADEHALRVVPILVGLGFLASTWLLARRTVGAASAAWALVVLASAKSLVRLSTDLLSDVPAAALLIAALAVIVDEVDRDDGPRWRLVLIAPLFAAAFYIRYGSAVPIAVFIVASVLVGARTLLRRPLPVLAAAALFVLLLVPHFLQAEALLDSPLGILLLSREVPHQKHVFDGLLTYVASNPFRFYGTVIPFVLVAGVVALRVRDRRRLLVWLAGVGTLVAMGLTTHGVVRYILVAIALLTVLGVDRLRSWLLMLPVAPRKLLSIAAVVALAVVWLQVARSQAKAGENRRDRAVGTLTAAPVIRADAAGVPCIVLGYHFPQLEWYSGCRAPLIMDAETVREAHRRGERVYVVRETTPAALKTWQPVFAELPGSRHVLFVLPGIVEVARLSDRS